MIDLMCFVYIIVIIMLLTGNNNIFIALEHVQNGQRIRSLE